jgi:putative restriction endonuclease
MVYKFDIKRLDVPTWEEIQHIETEIVESVTTNPQLKKDDTTYSKNEEKTRSALFSREVKSQYDYSCAVCGSQRFSPEGNPEVEAAHIYPKSERGSDDPRNGLALCRFHHWVFDSGWFVISDNLELIINRSGDREPPESIAALEGESLNDPTVSDRKPHPVFLQARRELYTKD